MLTHCDRCGSGPLVGWGRHQIAFGIAEHDKRAVDLCECHYHEFEHLLAKLVSGWLAQSADEVREGMLGCGMKAVRRRQGHTL
jgi:hypothetical protein